MMSNVTALLSRCRWRVDMANNAWPRQQRVSNDRVANETGDLHVSR